MLLDKIAKWFYRILGGLLLMISGQAIAEWEAAGMPEPDSAQAIVYWRVWIFLCMGIGCFVASHYARKESEKEIGGEANG